MSRGAYSLGKRQREAEKARKKRDKAERRAIRREQGPGVVEITTAEEILGDLPTAEEALRNMQERASAPRGAASVPCRLFVGGLSWDTTEQSLTAAFEAFGSLTDSVIVKDRDTGKSRGFGFVTMADRRDAQKAVQKLDGSDLDGRNIVVNVATER